MLQQPLISIALCTYNGERFLAQQIESLLAQDYPNFEIVVCDDMSSDGTVECIRNYRDPRISLHVNTRNLGFIRNFEQAFSLCRGDLIAPCDQDDIWHARKLSTLAAALDHHQLVYCDSEFINEDGKSLEARVSHKLNMYSGSDPAAFVFTNCVSGHAMLVRRTLVQRAIPFPAGQYHDWWLAFVAASVGSIQYVDACLVQYRQHHSAQTDLSGSQVQKNANKDSNRLEEFAGIIKWVAAMKEFGPSPHQAYFSEMHAAWLEWCERYFSPKLYRLLSERRDTLYFIDRHLQRKRFRQPQRYFWGLRTKQLVSPHRYARVSGCKPA